MQALLDAVGRRVLQIHASTRTDRELLMSIWRQQHGVMIPLQEAVMMKNGAQGCMMSHRTVASVLRAPYLVLEDDAIPTLAMFNADLVFRTIQAIQSGEFDILYLGGLLSLSRVSRTRFPGIVQGRSLATYAMVVGPKAAKFMSQLEWRGIPIDTELVRSNLKTAFVHPPLFVMAETHSDIGKNEFLKSQAFASLLSRVAPLWRTLIVWQKEWTLGLVLCFLVLCLWSQANGRRAKCSGG